MPTDKLNIIDETTIFTSDKRHEEQEKFHDD